MPSLRDIWIWSWEAHLAQFSILAPPKITFLSRVSGFPFPEPAARACAYDTNTCTAVRDTFTIISTKEKSLTTTTILHRRTMREPPLAAKCTARCTTDKTHGEGRKDRRENVFTPRKQHELLLSLIQSRHTSSQHALRHLHQFHPQLLRPPWIPPIRNTKAHIEPTQWTIPSHLGLSFLPQHAPEPTVPSS
jgi:hypothetical protein